MRRNCKQISLGILPLLLIMLVGCGGDGDTEHSGGEQTSRATSNGDAKYGGTFRMNILRGDPNGLDPILVDSKHGDDIASQIFDKLIDLDDSLNVVPELSRDLPEISEDGKTYTFTLRDDVFFHDNVCFPDGKGRRVTAEDVKYSLTRCCDPRMLTKAYWAFKGKVKGATEYFDAAQGNAPLDEVTGFKVLNDSTFQIELIEPYAPFIYILVRSFVSVVPREAVEKYGKDFAFQPVGTGPFQFVHWKQLENILLTRNPQYWGKSDSGDQLPYLDSVRFSFIKDDKTQFTAFLAGQFDEMFNIPTEVFPEVIDPEKMIPTKKYAQYQVQAEPAMLTWYFAFNNRRPPFTDANVRQAFNYVIDRAKIVRYVLQNSPYAPAVHGLVPPVFSGYPVESIQGYDYDVETGRQKLAAAGYPNGEGFPEVELYIYDEPRLKQVAEAVQGQLETGLNIKVSIEQMTFPQVIDLAESGKIDFWGTRWYGDYPDPETYLNLLNGQIVPDVDTVPSTPNSMRYDNAEFNDLFNKAMRTIDYQARLKLYAEAERLAMDDAPILPLFYERHYRLLQPWVRGLTLNPMARYDLKYVWYDGYGSKGQDVASN